MTNEEKKVLEIVEKEFDKIVDPKAKLIESYYKLTDDAEEYGKVDDELLYKVIKDLKRAGADSEVLDQIKTYGSYIY